MGSIKEVSSSLNILLIICLIILLFQIEGNKLTGAATTIDGQVDVEVATTCGDNVTAGSEICDGTDLEAATCLTRGFDGGTLGCSSNCLSFNTTSCTTITEETEIIRVGRGGIAPKLIFNVDTTNQFDAAISKTMTVYIIFKEETYLFNLQELENYAIFKLKHPTDIPLSYYKIAEGQTITIDLNEDGIADLYLTLTDILTRRAAFHMEKFRPLIIGTPKSQSAKQHLEIAVKNFKPAHYLFIILIISLITIYLISHKKIKKEKRK